VRVTGAARGFPDACGAIVFVVTIVVGRGVGGLEVGIVVAWEDIIAGTGVAAVVGSATPRSLSVHPAIAIIRRRKITDIFMNGI